MEGRKNQTCERDKEEGYGNLEDKNNIGCCGQEKSVSTLKSKVVIVKKKVRMRSQCRTDERCGY